MKFLADLKFLQSHSCNERKFCFLANSIKIFSSCVLKKHYARLCCEELNSVLLGEGTTNTWWFLLHNDRKSWHRRIKKQCCYEGLHCNTSQLFLWVWWWVIHGLGGWVQMHTLPILQGGVVHKSLWVKIRMSLY